MLPNLKTQKDALSLDQALQILKSFLDRFYEKRVEVIKSYEFDPTTTYSDVQVLLAELELDSNGDISDLEVRQLWKDSIEETLPNYEKNQSISFLQVYFLSRRFLEKYSKNTVADEIGSLVELMDILNMWMRSIADVMKQ